MLIYVFILVFIIFVYQKYFILKEGIVFSKDFFLQKYEKDNIILDRNNKTLTKDDIIIHYSTINEGSKYYSLRNKKPIMNSILSKHGIPVSKSYLWDKNIPLDENLKHVQSLNFPLVVKPPSGQKGYGVTTDIVSTDMLLKKINALPKNVYIEEQAIGKEYRILMINGTIIGITMKSSPSIMGDGKNSISSLIDEHNNTRKQNNRIHTIDHDYIKRQGYTIDDILPLNQSLIVTNVSNRANGSHVTYIDIEYVHPINIMLFKKINQVVDLKLIGIDFICEDISLPYDLNGVVLEVNPNPGFGIHYDVYPDDKKEDLIDSVIDTMFIH
jgi:cyanophycin synthetase